MEWGKHNALTVLVVCNSFVDYRAPMGQSDPTNGHP
jgi:hypothetical protein